jgi:hypothetical protein
LRRLRATRRIDEQLSRHDARGHEIEIGLLHEERAVVALRPRALLGMREQMIAIRHLEQEASAGPQRPRHLGEHALVVIVLEVAERGEVRVHGVIRGGDPECAHVALDPRHLDAGGRRIGRGDREVVGIEVEPGDAMAELRHADRMPTETTGEVEHRRARLHAERIGDEARLRGGLLDLELRAVDA